MFSVLLISIFAARMRKIREHILFRIFGFVLALHILNCAVDIPDPQPQYIAENLSYNEMESLVEVALEEVLQINDAIAEYDDLDADDTYNFAFKKVITFCSQESAPIQIENTTKPNTHIGFVYEALYVPLFHPEITSPPPWLS